VIKRGVFIIPGQKCALAVFVPPINVSMIMEVEAYKYALSGL
jgi:hypothetical protein